ncbi:MAG: PhnD/SsuA/transferrin family substrate-binding protein [Oscillospiraceae bacterium]|nr:PhnD/SsuA/transferrin family substrate-binding protein [Oscillospiraceae bacterium]
MKRFFALLLCLTCLLCACKGKGEAAEQGGGEKEPTRIDVLRIVFVPSHDVQNTLADAQPLCALLKEALAPLGYEVGDVALSVGESFEDVGRILASNEADVAIGMPGGTYVLFDDACDVILTSTRNGLSKDYDDARQWNDQMPTVPIDIQTVFYRSLIIAGPSEKGRELADKVNSGEELTWEDLDSAVWSIMDVSSSAGYIYPMLWLEQHWNKDVGDLKHVMHSASYDEAFSRLASGEVDVLATYADARREFIERWNGEFGREESVWGETDVIGVTPGIYNDTVTVSKSSPIMDEAFKSALQDAFIQIAENTEGGKSVLEIYDHKGYQKAVSADYDNERAAQELIKKLS